MVVFMETMTKDVHSVGDNILLSLARNVMNILGKPQVTVQVSSIKEVLENISASLLGPLVAKIK